MMAYRGNTMSETELTSTTPTGATMNGQDEESPPSPADVAGVEKRGKNPLSRWEVLDALHDAWTVLSSIVDIVTDIVVAYEFYKNGQETFFLLSLVIFVAAQLSYAFLFTGTWAAAHSTQGKILVFVCVLPFGQLIPIFAWLESFRFIAVDSCLVALKLTPTGTSGEASATDNPAALAATAETGDEDSLWEFIQRKYAAHAGFLAEAFVEAIPQGVLQTVAVLVLERREGEALPWLNVFSILMSITVVASKGYLVSYSIHRPSFAFNYTCIAADAFNLFATSTWLFVGLASAVGGSGGNNADDNNDGFVGSNGDVSEGSEGPLERHPWFCWPALAGMACCCVGGFALLCFTMFDDHLKALHPGIYGTGAAGNGGVYKSVWFDVYLVRGVAWVLAVVPVSVVYVSSKLSLLPVLLFGSLDPEHAVHAKFYRPLFQFLSGRLGEDRVLAPKKTATSTQQQQQQRQQQQKQQQRSSSSVVSALHNSAHYRGDRSKFGALDQQLRLQVANRFLLEAKNSESKLTKALTEGEKQNSANARNPARNGSGGGGGGGGGISSSSGGGVLTVAAAARLSLQRWLQDLDTTDNFRLPTSSTTIEESSLSESAAAAAAAAAAANPTRAEDPRIRAEKLRALRDSALEHGNTQLRARSEILRHFLVALEEEQERRKVQTREQEMRRGEEQGEGDKKQGDAENNGSSGGGGGSGGGSAEGNISGESGWGALLGVAASAFSAGCVGLLSALAVDLRLALCSRSRSKMWFQPKHRVFTSDTVESSWAPVVPPPIKFCWRSFQRRSAALRRVLLRVGGLLCLLVVAASALVLLPASLVFLAYSAVFPLHQMHRCHAPPSASSSSAAPSVLLLPCILSWGYVGCLAVLLALAPLVSRFQTTRADLRSAKGFPEVFYSKLAVADVYQRYAAARARLEVTRFVHSKVGRFNAIEVFSYLDEAVRHAAYK